MWNLIDIHFKNFISHRDTSYTFQDGQTVMIYGKNNDDIGANSNGSGKSTIIKAITIALVGLPNRDLGQEDFILDGEDTCSIELSLENKVLGKTLKIERVFYKTSSSEITLQEDGKVNNQITGVAEGDKRILQLLDITKEDLLNYFIINQENTHSFFRAGDTDKKKIISRFTNSILVDKAIEAIDKDYSDKVSEIQSQNQLIENINVKIQTLTEQIEYEQTNKEQELKEQLSTYNDEIRTLSDELNKIVEKQRVVIKESIPELEQQITQLKLSIPNKDKLVDKLDKKKKIVAEKERELSETKALKKDIGLKIEGEMECPKCKHTWSTVDPEANIEELKEMFSQLELIKEDSDSSIKTMEEEIVNLRTLLNGIQLKRSKLNTVEQQLDDLKDDLNSYQRRISSKQSEISAYEGKIKEAKAFKKNKKRIQELQDQILEEENKTTEILQNIEKLEEEKTKIDFWRINMGNMGFRTYLVNSVLKSLEGYVNFNLKKFNTSLQIVIEGFRVLKSKKVSEKIDVLVTKDGENWKKYQRFSGGQRMRIEICGILSLQKLINLSSKSGGLNFLGLDELFEGLDENGQRESCKILEKSKVTTLIISHHDSNSDFKNKVVVDYTNGISKII